MIATSVVPNSATASPTAQGRGQLIKRPSVEPTKNSKMMATAFETRSATETSPKSKNGIATGKVDRKTRKKIMPAPRRSSRVGIALAGGHGKSLIPAAR